MVASGMLLTRVLDGLALGIVLVVGVAVPVLVARGARRHGASRTGACGRGLASLALLPVGLGLYLLVGWRVPVRAEESG